MVRKSILQSRLQEQEFTLNTLTAAHIEVDRGKLADWDASARSVSLTFLET